MEVITGVGRRRRWRLEDELRIAADVLARIADHPVARLDELLPWNRLRSGHSPPAAA